MRIIITYLFIFCSTFSWSQVDFVSIETEIVATIKILRQAQEEGDAERQLLFSKKLKKQLFFALVQAGSRYYHFGQLRQLLRVEYSDDFRLRTFSWLARVAGNRHHTETLIQYQANNQTQVVDLYQGDSSTWNRTIIDEIHRIPYQNKDYYLLIGEAFHGSGFKIQTCWLYYFEGQQFKRLSLAFNTDDCLINKTPIARDCQLRYTPQRRTLYVEQIIDHQKVARRFYWVNGAFRG